MDAGDLEAQEKAESPLTSSQRALLELFRSRSGLSITLEEVLKATGWKASTWKAYRSKGVLAPYIRVEEDGSLFVTASANLAEWSFMRQVTQTASSREIGAPCASKLARALLRKARDNMVLALELYNRPTLENRLDAFCILFCTAWEQLLKAEIIEAEGELAIFRDTKEGRRRETISLEKAAEKQFAANDPVKANIATIAELRHDATHLLMPEVQGVLSRIFQAGVLNFARRFLKISGQPLFPPSTSGLLSIVGEFSEPNILDLKRTYGNAAALEIADLIASLQTSISNTKDDRYAIPLDYKLVLTKGDSSADIKLTTSPEGAGQALIVEKPVPIEASHPYSTKDLVAEVQKQTQRAFNTHDLESAVQKEKWKKSNNEFHHYQQRLKTHWYSPRAAAALASKIASDEEYLINARASLRHSRQKKSAASVGAPPWKR
jgi:hypothetical protein